MFAWTLTGATVWQSLEVYKSGRCEAGGLWLREVDGLEMRVLVEIGLAAVRMWKHSQFWSIHSTREEALKQRDGSMARSLHRWGRVHSGWNL